MATTAGPSRREPIVDKDDSGSESGSSTDSREEDEEGWDDVEPEDGDEDAREEVISLLDDRVFPDVAAMLAHCRDQHGFDFLAVRQRLQLDFHGSVKLVNFVRQRVHEGLPVTGEDITLADIDHDQYLKPVLDDDAVILGLFDLPEVVPSTTTTTTTATSDAAGSSAGGANGASDNTPLVNDLLARNAELREELARAAAQFDSYRAAVQQTLDQRWGDVVDADADAEAVAKAERERKEKERERRQREKKKGGELANPNDESKYYWDSYSQIEIHETMLKDTVRTDAYRDFIYSNKHLFKGKTVLDIGCGTGILSMFCARAGASRVYAVDASAIIGKARANVARNGLSDIITCVHGKIEEVTLPGFPSPTSPSPASEDGPFVDIIVSEWMGYCLLFEAMLPSVLWARDRYLNPRTGLLVPSHTSLRLAPAADPEWAADYGRTFWRDVYGFDMRAVAAGGSLEDEVRVIQWGGEGVASSVPSKSPSTIATTEKQEGGEEEEEEEAFKVLDLYAATTANLSFKAPFRTTLARDIDALDGFVVWFDTFFSPRRAGHETQVAPGDAPGAWVAAGGREEKGGDRIAFTTAPWATPTHWKQGLLICNYEDGDDEEEKEKENGEEKKPVPMKKGDVVQGDVEFGVNEDNPRGLSIRMAWSWNGGSKTQTWDLK
ncbi:Ribosomal protein arginine N-methyltransferase rmt3 [Diatrype stigma]|uniref:type I protein arginine methyltransferase n=1 Tax=Diatrype stigma TaxID=117547 RepID=A0AAN9UT82_9PEZI